MKIQFLNWYSEDTWVQDTCKFAIYGFGRSADLDGSVCVIFQNMCPYFYVELAEGESVGALLAELRTQSARLAASVRGLGRRAARARLESRGVRGMPSDELWTEVCVSACSEADSRVFLGRGFEGGKTYRFARVVFQTLRAHRVYADVLRNTAGRIVCESNVAPMLKFFHDHDIDPCGWISVQDTVLRAREPHLKWSKAQHEYILQCDHFRTGHVRALRETDALWFKLMSYDLECDSSHGDYPVAAKDYSKVVHNARMYISQRPPLCRADIDALCRDLNRAPHEAAGPFARVHLKNADVPPIEIDALARVLTGAPADGVRGVIPGAAPPRGEPDYEALHALLRERWGEGNVCGDPIIQIGCVVEFPRGCYKRVIFCLGETRMPPGDASVQCVSCVSEAELILRWSEWFEQEDPDIVLGYNVYNFDNEYLWTRARECCVPLEGRLSRVERVRASLRDMTKGHGKFLQMNGRDVLDLMDYVKKNHSLDSYSLDNVAARFIRGRIARADAMPQADMTHIRLAGAPIALRDGDFFKIYVNNGIYEEKYEHAGTTKFQIERVVRDETGHAFVVRGALPLDTSVFVHEWCLSKDDITPQQIFAFQKGTPEQRGQIAKYCIQDCMLCHYLFQKLEVLVNNMAMANVCVVPFGFLFLRGQSVKIFSLISKLCAESNYRIPVQDFPDDNDAEEESYEGALVLDPQTGVYVDEPIAVTDFNSLYPSCGIAENICPSTIVLDPAYLDLPGYTYNHITFDEFELQHVFGKNGRVKKNREPVRVGSVTCTYVVYPDGEKGILPRIWQQLLQKRKETRKRMETETDAFRRTLLDGLQLAFKVTANSMYGIFGFCKSPLYYRNVAASITAAGRRNLMFAKDFIEREYPGSRIVYGDTDSLFIAFPSQKQGLDRVYECIDLATEAGERVSAALKPPHNLGFEKCVAPFVLMSRKRYSGLYYTSKTPKCYMNTMGFVLKRRDNALIVKDIVGNAVKKILYERDIAGSIAYVKGAIRRMLAGEYGLDMFVITKTLRSQYANPTHIAHYMLAKRMGERDPGNRPKVGDRIPFVYVPCAKKDALQGDRVEHPAYVVANGVPIDYMYYLEHQIMSPLMQIYSLVFRDETHTLVFADLIRDAQHASQQQQAIYRFVGCSSDTTAARTQAHIVARLDAYASGATQKTEKKKAATQTKITHFLKAK